MVNLKKDKSIYTIKITKMWYMPYFVWTLSAQYPLPRTLQIFIDNLKKNSFLLCACDPH